MRASQPLDLLLEMSPGIADPASAESFVVEKR
jgi:hypothetical protein